MCVSGRNYEEARVNRVRFKGVITSENERWACQGLESYVCGFQAFSTTVAIFYSIYQLHRSLTKSCSFAIVWVVSNPDEDWGEASDEELVQEIRDARKQLIKARACPPIHPISISEL